MMTHSRRGSLHSIFFPRAANDDMQLEYKTCLRMHMDPFTARRERHADAYGSLLPRAANDMRKRLSQIDGKFFSFPARPVPKRLFCWQKILSVRKCCVPSYPPSENFVALNDDAFASGVASLLGRLASLDIFFPRVANDDMQLEYKTCLRMHMDPFTARRERHSVGNINSRISLFACARCSLGRAPRTSLGLIAALF